MNAPKLTPEQTAMLNATQQMSLVRLQLMFPDARELQGKRMQEAAAHSAQDLVTFQPVTKWLLRDHSKDGEILQLLIVKPSPLVGVEERVMALVETSTLLETEEGSQVNDEFMHGLTIDAVVHSPTTRAVLYYRGFRLKFHVKKPAEPAN